jgi:hypothetical protein
MGDAVDDDVVVVVDVAVGKFLAPEMQIRIDARGGRDERQLVSGQPVSLFHQPTEYDSLSLTSIARRKMRVVAFLAGIPGRLLKTCDF